MELKKALAYAAYYYALNAEECIKPGVVESHRPTQLKITANYIIKSTACFGIMGDEVGYDHGRRILREMGVSEQSISECVIQEGEKLAESLRIFCANPASDEYRLLRILK